MDLGVIAMKVYSTFLNAQGLEPHHETQSCFKTLDGGGVIPFFRDAVGLFKIPADWVELWSTKEFSQFFFF